MRMWRRRYKSRRGKYEDKERGIRLYLVTATRHTGRNWVKMREQDDDNRLFRNIF